MQFTAFDHQVAGHADSIFYHKDLLYKKTVDAEVHFYKNAQNSPLSSIIPSFHGTEMVDGCNYIILENLTHGMHMPNIIDLKLGTRLFANDASLEKQERMIKVANETTSGTFCITEGTLVVITGIYGIRIAGLQVYKNQNLVRQNSNWGKNLDHASLKSEIRSFFSQAEKDQVMAQLESVLAIVKGTSMECFSCSLLVCYNDEHLKIKLIDFQHSVIGGASMDTGMVLGLQSLIDICHD